MGSLELSDTESAAVQKTSNRVTLASMIEKIAHEEYIHPQHTKHMTICILTLVNGFTLVGESAPADAGNFDADLGRKLAREDAIRTMWKLEGYALRERLSAAP